MIRLYLHKAVGELHMSNHRMFLNNSFGSEGNGAQTPAEGDGILGQLKSSSIIHCMFHLFQGRLLNEYSMSPYGAHPCILAWKKSTGTKEKSDGGRNRFIQPTWECIQ